MTIALGILVILVTIALTILVLMQSGKGKELGSAIAGGNNSYLGNRVISIVPHEGNFKITFSGKAGIELPAGHFVRQHADGRRAILGPPTTVSGEWKKYEFIIVKGISPDAKATNKLFPGVAKISPLLVVPGAINIKEFKLEKVK